MYEPNKPKLSLVSGQTPEQLEARRKLAELRNRYWRLPSERRARASARGWRSY